MPVLPWPSEGQGTQTLCPDKDQRLGKQSSGKSLLNTFHCKNNRTGSDPRCLCRAATKQSSHLAPAAPCPLSCQHGTSGGKAIAQGSHGLSYHQDCSPQSPQGQPHTSCCGWEQSRKIWHLQMNLCKVLFASGRNKGTPFRQALVFPAIGLVTGRIKQPN